MKKFLKYSFISLVTLLLSAVLAAGFLYIVKPRVLRRLLGRARHTVSYVFRDRLKGRPYSEGDYDGIDVSKNNGVIRWKEVAKDERIKFVFVKATEGKGYVDPLYHRNIRQARKAGLMVGSYHFFTSRASAMVQFEHFRETVKKSEQDLVPVLDVEELGIRGRWNGRELQDSVRVFAELVKRYYGKYPIIYSNEHFYNKELGHAFNRYYLFIANYRRKPKVKGNGEHNIWQYSERGHLHGIGEYVDLNRFQNGSSVEDIRM